MIYISFQYVYSFERRHFYNVNSFVRFLFELNQKLNMHKSKRFMFSKHGTPFLILNGISGEKNPFFFVHVVRAFIILPLITNSCVRYIVYLFASFYDRSACIFLGIVLANEIFQQQQRQKNTIE